MNWINVSDLKAWKSEVVKSYTVSGIPDNFLISGEGKIIARNLRGEKLINMLDSLMIIK